MSAIQSGHSTHFSSKKSKSAYPDNDLYVNICISFLPCFRSPSFSPPPHDIFSGWVWAPKLKWIHLLQPLPLLGPGPDSFCPSLCYVYTYLLTHNRWHGDNTGHSLPRLGSGAPHRENSRWTWVSHKKGQIAFRGICLVRENLKWILFRTSWPQTLGVPWPKVLSCICHTSETQLTQFGVFQANSDSTEVTGYVPELSCRRLVASLRPL